MRGIVGRNIYMYSASRRGFTLIELTVVLLIVAILAGVVTLRLQGPLHRAEMRDVIERIAFFDHLTRVHAREHDRPLRLVVDIVAGDITRNYGDSIEQAGAPFELPRGCEFTKLYVGGDQISAGSTSMICSRRGITPTYALQVEHDTGLRQWILVAGLTGDAVEVSDEDIEAIAKALGPAAKTAGRDAR